MKKSRNEATIKRFVEQRGGVYFKVFDWPAVGAQHEEFFSFKPPKGHLIHSAIVGKKCYLYSMPELRLPRQSEPSREVVSTPEYAAK